MRPLPMKLRHTFFRWACWGFVFILIALAAIFAVTILAKSSIDTKAGFFTPIIALGIGFIYFAQHQILDESRLFKELFTEFNTRYDKLNDELLDIRRGEMKDNSTKARKTLIDYFNLCAEEFFFYERGLIDEDVWRSWCRGMLFYIDHPNIRSIWEEEVAQISHYGLTTDCIRKGAV